MLAKFGGTEEEVMQEMVHEAEHNPSQDHHPTESNVGMPSGVRRTDTEIPGHTGAHAGEVMLAIEAQQLKVKGNDKKHQPPQTRGRGKGKGNKPGAQQTMVRGKGKKHKAADQGENTR